MELEATSGRILRIWWAFMWRGGIALFIFMIMLKTLGAVIGFVLEAIGVPANVTDGLGAVAAIIAALFGSMIPFFLIVNNNFGDFRLSLVPRNIPPKEPYTTEKENGDS